MKLTVTTDLKNNNYTATFSVKEITLEETELFTDFGDIEINVGGEIKDATPTTLVTLGNSYKKFPSEFPFSRSFNQASHGVDTEAIATAYVKDITDKIEAAVVILKAKTDAFSGETDIIL